MLCVTCASLGACDTITLEIRGAAMRVQVINEVMTGDSKVTSRGELCLQWCLYVYDDGSSQNGYRFIRRRPDGNLQPARGQARIPSLRQAMELIETAKSEGWGDYDADNEQT
jgi:hypothetical protein